MLYAVMQIIFLFLDFIYLFIKLCPTRHKVVFLSRQSNKPSNDITMIVNRLHEVDPAIETVVLCRKLEGGIKAKLSYIGHMFIQMYHIATSETAVLDSYCIVISCLHHKKSLKVIQMWHALGCIKKFGYGAIGKSGGSSLKIARAMHMHEKYDIVFTASEDTRQAFSEAFNVSPDIIVNAPLPKVDVLRDRELTRQKEEEIKNKYPQMKDKTNIVYAPTFRADDSILEKAIYELIDSLDFGRYNLIICLHPLSKFVINDPRVIVDKNYYTYEMASVADAVITDYSATAYEMALMDKRLYYYVFDSDSYASERGYYMPLSEFPGPKCRDLKSLLTEIDKPDYDQQAVRDFVNKYFDPSITNCTDHIVNIILDKKK
ncbi:MAG: CDP-glycerol glycerophosphotransferase family protein [Erysipelotrichaceae bacterium]|nr:CDP-glycerol glycerophosphotransferase family protein [Erysipelotrichaceae bacterium]